MKKKEDINKDKPKKEKKRPIYKVKGFTLTFSKSILDDMLRGACSPTKPKKK